MLFYALYARHDALQSRLPHFRRPGRPGACRWQSCANRGIHGTKKPVPHLAEQVLLSRATGTRTPNSGARNRCVANYTIALCRLERAEYTQGAPGCQEIFLPFFCFLQFSGGGWRRRLRRSGVHPARRRRCRRRNLHLPRRGKALPNPGFAGFLHGAGYARGSWCVSRSR